jgi:predicted CXXCH cytochrome family protein
MRHGRNNRNDYCFNCHDPQNIEQLKASAGQTFKITESSRLCGSCHGPTYRDWEAGIHGRTSGYWNRQAGATTREDCTSCHDPHNPEFPSMKPGPGPHLFRASQAAKPSKGH